MMELELIFVQSIFSSGYQRDAFAGDTRASEF